MVEVLLQKKRIPGSISDVVRTRRSQAIEHASCVPMKIHSMQLRIEVDLAKRKERLSLEHPFMCLQKTLQVRVAGLRAGGQIV